MSKKYYTIQELADLFVMTEGHIRNLIQKGEIPSVKIFGSVRIKTEDVEKLIQPREVKVD